MTYGIRRIWFFVRLLFGVAVLSTCITANAVTWYLAVQTTNTVNTYSYISQYKGQYSVNGGTWTDFLVNDWFGSGIYYNATGLLVSHTGTFAMRLVRISDTAVIGTVGPWSLTSGGPLASQPDRTVTMTDPGPTTWSLHKQLKNTGDTRRRYRIDIDGDGDWDTSPELGPGETFDLNITRDTAPTEDITIEQAVYLGDGQYGWETTGSIPTGDWTTGTPTPTPKPLPPPTPKAVDTTSQSSTNTAYGSPTGGNVQESTFKTGIESLKGTVASGSDKAAEAVDKLRLALKEWFAYDEDYNPDADAAGGQSATATKRAEIKATIDNAKATNITALATGSTAGTSPGDDFWWWGPAEARVYFGQGVHASFFGWGRQFLLWFLILSYVGWFYTYTFQALHRVMLTQQGISAGKLPLASGLLSWALIIVIFSVIGLATITLTSSMTAAALQVAANSTWQSYTIASVGGDLTITVPRMLYVANLYVPLEEAFNLITSATAHIWTAESIAAAAILSIKAATA